MFATILKLLTLCALAHFISGHTLKEQPITTEQKYLIVRGEILEGSAASQEHVDFNNAAKLLLSSFKAQRAVAMEGVEECSEPTHKANFSGIDYFCLLAMLVVSLGIGIFYGFFETGGSSSDDFLLGSGMSLLPVTLSLTTSFITAIELLGNPAEMYFKGTQFVVIVLPMVMVIPVAVKVFYPIYFKMELTSCYEYLGIRFGKEIRIFGALLYVIQVLRFQVLIYIIISSIFVATLNSLQMCFYTAVAVLAPAIALSKATGLDTRIAVILIYVVCVFYSSMGGIKACVIADSFQVGAKVSRFIISA